MYSYFLHRKIVNFDHSYRRDFAIFCLCKVGRDPPLHLTLSIMKWEWQKIGNKTVARALNNEYLVNKLNIYLRDIIFFENNSNKIVINIFRLCKSNRWYITVILV